MEIDLDRGHARARTRAHVRSTAGHDAGSRCVVNVYLATDLWNGCWLRARPRAITLLLARARATPLATFRPAVSARPLRQQSDLGERKENPEGGGGIFAVWARTRSSIAHARARAGVYGGDNNRATRLSRCVAHDKRALHVSIRFRCVYIRRRIDHMFQRARGCSENLIPSRCFVA